MHPRSTGGTLLTRSLAVPREGDRLQLELQRLERVRDPAELRVQLLDLVHARKHAKEIFSLTSLGEFGPEISGTGLLPRDSCRRGPRRCALARSA